MFEQLVKHLQRMDGKRLEIYAKGHYPLTKGQKRKLRASRKTNPFSGGRVSVKTSGTSKTPVQAVAKYQNDGTRYIQPARFVEKAISIHRGWTVPIMKAFEAMMLGTKMKSNPFTGGTVSVTGSYSLAPLEKLGERIAKDIAKQCMRIDTGRLKRSFTYRIK